MPVMGLPPMTLFLAFPKLEAKTGSGPQPCSLFNCFNAKHLGTYFCHLTMKIYTSSVSFKLGTRLILTRCQIVVFAEAEASRSGEVVRGRQPPEQHGWGAVRSNSSSRDQLIERLAGS